MFRAPTHTHLQSYVSAQTHMSAHTHECIKYIVVHTKHDHSHAYVDRHAQCKRYIHNDSHPFLTNTFLLTSITLFFLTHKHEDTHTHTHIHLSWCQTLHFHPSAQCASPRQFKYRPASSHGTSLNHCDTVGSDCLRSMYACVHIYFHIYKFIYMSYNNLYFS